MDRKEARVFKCPKCGGRIKTFKTDGSWLICYNCKESIRLEGFSCNYNVRCKRCGKGYNPTERGSITRRVCPKCLKLRVRI